MRKPTTGEPCAGEPLARFGGRGGESLPYPITMLEGMMVTYTIAVVVVNLLSDLAYGFADPRITFG